MGTYTEREGDLIAESLEGNFDVISHGCNCFCTQKSGIAAPMSQTFHTNTFRMESGSWKGDYNKMGTIDYTVLLINPEQKQVCGILHREISDYNPNRGYKELTVVNSYTQYRPGPDGDYTALRLCMRKINHEFKGKKVGLPRIGCGLAGLNWENVKPIIKLELKDCEVTVLIK